MASASASKASDLCIRRPGRRQGGRSGRLARTPRERNRAPAIFCAGNQPAFRAFRTVFRAGKMSSTGRKSRAGRLGEKGIRREGETERRYPPHLLASASSACSSIPHGLSTGREGLGLLLCSLRHPTHTASGNTGQENGEPFLDSRQATGSDRPARLAVPTAMAQPFSSPHIPSSSWVTRRPPPSTSSPSAFTTRTSSSPITVCRPRRRAVAPAASLHFGPGEIAEVARNKVLIAATVASAIGQLSKPFTSGKNGGAGAGLDLRTVFRSGGMPSTHSASVVAVATSLGLERGFADSIFGMSVVFAAIVMYDAQGVRREVGNHAKVLNKFWLLKEKVPVEYSEVDMASEFVSVTEEAISSSPSNVSPSLKHSSSTESPRVNGLGSSELEVTELTELKQAYIAEGYRLSESVGHTELEVTVGALLGFAVSLAVYAIL